MFFFTIWGGAEVRPRDPDNVVVTVWGGTEILLPTLAEKMLRIKKVKTDTGEITDAVIRRTNVITLMGGTTYRKPTLAREIEEMKEIKESRSIPESEMIDLWQEVLRREDMDLFESLTIMGGCGDDVPGLKVQLKDLNRIASRGIISSDEKKELRALLEGTDTARPDAVQEKLRSMLLPVTDPLPAPASSKATPIRSALLE